MVIRKLVIVLAILVALYQFGIRGGLFPDLSRPASTSVEAADTQRPTAPSQSARTGDALSEAFKHHRSNVQVEGSGVVAKVLTDDNDGSRHQRFIVRLASGQTVLIAHNIDLAPRVESLHEGDALSFAGEYEWNDRGGVVHWTHGDPGGHHVGGWLKHDGRVYQ